MGMNKEALEHISRLEKHGVQVVTAVGKTPVTRGFYRSIIAFCRRYKINCIGYDIEVPGAESDHMMLAIWQNGHVDSGSAENIRVIMDQEWGIT